jgi:sugar phosphate isomerase/epimerase
MKAILTFILLFSTFCSYSQQKSRLQFFQTDWGRNVSWDAFCEKTKASGYDGVETWFPKKTKNRLALNEALKKYDLKVVYLAGTDKSVDFETGLKRYTEDLRSIASTAPVAINCHTGSDFFTFEQNKAFIDVANQISKENNIPIYHETHRGRFSFSLPDTEKYLNEIPDLQLTLDVSHWVVVHESLLEPQEKNLEIVIDRTHHIHARVGHAEGPQVNDPKAPEWQKALERHLDIWEKAVRKRWGGTDIPFTITTEFGPPTYMPTLPYTQVPVADQWKANVFIMKSLKERLEGE